jgi:hypothetical protein
MTFGKLRRLMGSFLIPIYGILSSGTDVNLYFWEIIIPMVIFALMAFIPIWDKENNFGSGGFKSFWDFQ